MMLWSTTLLTKADVYVAFITYLPAKVDIVFVDLDDYIQKALLNPFIQRQIGVGIYDHDNIKTDFLSAAVAYPQQSRLEISLDLINAHAEGVDLDLVEAYLHNMAVHEAHHFHESNAPGTAIEHAHNELECIEAVRQKYPDLDAKSQQFEAVSPVYQRVYARIKALQGR